MKLRTKLFLGVGILFLLMIIIMYILPIYFVRRDVYKAADEIHELLLEERQELVRNQKIWAENVVESIKQNLDAILMMLYVEKPFSTMEFKEVKSGLFLKNAALIGDKLYVVYSTRDHPELYIYNAKSGEKLHSIRLEERSKIAFSSDGKRVVVSGLVKFYVVDTQSLEKQDALFKLEDEMSFFYCQPGPGTFPASITFNQKGDRIFSVDRNGNVFVQSVETGSKRVQIGEEQGHQISILYHFADPAPLCVDGDKCYVLNRKTNTIHCWYMG